MSELPQIIAHTYASYINVSAELLRMHGPDARTDKEKAEASRLYAEKRARIDDDKRRVWAAILANGDPLHLHHGPREYGSEDYADPANARCEGCDAEGYEWEYPNWPCSSAVIAADLIGVPFTDETRTAW